MKKIFATLFSSGLLIASTGHGQIITPVSISQTSGPAANGSPSIIIDGVIPPEMTPFDTAGLTVSWTGTLTSFTMDLGGVFNINDVLYSVDNNDSYELDYSLDGTHFTELFANGIDSGAVTESAGGLDTEVSAASPFIPVGTFEVNPTMSFTPVDAKFLRVEAIAGDNLYGIGEVMPFGTPVMSAVPEPATYGYCAAGLLVAFAAWKRRLFALST